MVADRSQVQVKTSRIIKKITQEKIYQETECIKIPQNEYTDKVVDVTFEVQKQSPQMQTMHRKSWRRKPDKRVWVGRPIRWTSTGDVQWKTPEMKAHSENLMNVSDMQILGEDDRFVAQPPPYDRSEQQDRERWFSVRQQDRERANLDAHFPVSPANSKIVTEQIWINQVTSKIVLQPLESDTDAQLYKERVVSVRKAAEFASRVLSESVPSEMRTS